MLLGLSPEKTREVMKELNEDGPHVLKDNFKRITDWMKTQPHLPQNYGKKFTITSQRLVLNPLTNTVKNDPVLGNPMPVLGTL